ncbi:diguanylate cyclase [Alicyclobacillus sp. SP_1]|uniref:diguanylate cyclase n=1 Tax=Alicyclobacillus sp. SP_1 TaxID=2942475 RepID=UPI00215775A6|nr:HD domain-containing phosphohydrolase [Alicyclobacillus sp. SP_1]
MDMDSYVVTYALIGLLALTSAFEIDISQKAYFSWETAFYIGFILSYPTVTVALGGIVAGFILSFRKGKRWLSFLYSYTIICLSSIIAYELSLLTFNRSGQIFHISLLSLVFFAVVYFTANMFFVFLSYYVRFGVDGLVDGAKSIFTGALLGVYGVGILTGYLLALVIHSSGLRGTILFTALILIVSRVYREYFKMAQHFKDLAITDELTRLHNHRYIHTWMDDRIAAEEPFSVLLMDIDNFKRYNELFGHLHGDKALTFLGKLMRSTAREGEQVSRYSGEEFVITIPDVSVEVAEERANAFRKAIEEAEFPGPDQSKKTHITASIGVARYPEMADKKQNLMVAADDALYRIKVAARNRVAVYSTVVEDIRRELDGLDVSEDIINTLELYMQMMNTRDRYTYRHTERNVRYAGKLAERLGLSLDVQRHIRIGAFLHDVGKLQTPIDVLVKRDPLSKEEWDIMRNHVEQGYYMVHEIKSLRPCLDLIRHHHERFDGFGYPHGLKGEKIPFEARIMTIVDSFDAMTTSRPYQRRRTMLEAFDEFDACAGTQFDPALIEPFKEVVREVGILPSEFEEDTAIF